MRFFTFLSVMAILISVAVLIIVIIKSNAKDADKGGKKPKANDE